MDHVIKNDVNCYSKEQATNQNLASLVVLVLRLQIVEIFIVILTRVILLHLDLVLDLILIKVFAKNSEVRVKQNNKQHYDWFYQSPEEQRKQLLDEKDVSLLSSCLGDRHESQDVFLALGLKKSAIEIAERDYSSKVIKLKPSVQLLCKWTERKGSNATYDFLIDGLKEFEDYHPGLIEWEKIKDIFMKRQTR